MIIVIISITIITMVIMIINNNIILIRNNNTMLIIAERKSANRWGTRSPDVPGALPQLSRGAGLGRIGLFGSNLPSLLLFLKVGVITN